LTPTEEAVMSVHHSEEIHRNLIERVPQVTGKQLSEWFHEIDKGPSFLRFDERVNWLRDEHALPHGYAYAICREHERHRVSHE
jgi:hypothetical protein